MTRVKKNYDARNYNFVRTVGTGAGGDLSSSGSHVITLSPFPWGLSISSPVKITDGVTSEAVTPVWVAGVGGSPSGTITVTTVNGFSGGWSVRSATGGIQEAIETGKSTGIGFTVLIIEPVVLDAQVNVNAEGVKILGASRNNVTSLISRATGTLFHVTAGSVEISGCAFRGGRTASAEAETANIGIVLADGNAVRGNYHDLMFDLLYGGIRHDGGFHNKIANIWARNMSGYVFKHAGGVSPFVDTVTHDTDTATYNCSAEGGIVINASGAYIYNVDILHCQHGIVVQPIDARLEWTFIYDARLDQNYKYGLFIYNPAGSIHALQGVFVHSLWAASSGTTGLYGGNPAPVGAGVVIEGPAAITDVAIVGGQIFNNRDQNVKIHHGHRISMTHIHLPWANVGGSPNIDNIYISTPQRSEITSCEIGSNLIGGVQLRSGILADAGTGDVIVRDNHFDETNGAYTSGDPVHNLAANPQNIKTDGLNRGMDDIKKDMPSAEPLHVPDRRFIGITGTVTTNNILPVYEGRKLNFQKIGAGSWIIGTTGNVQTGLTLAEGQSAICEYTGTKWICIK